MRAAPPRGRAETSDELAAAFADREWRLLKAAKALLQEGGYDSLSLKALAENSKLARVTVYKHFANRQEVVLKLAIRSVERRADMSQRAALFDGLTRERIAGVASVIRFYLLRDIGHEVLAYEKGVWGRVTRELRERLKLHEARILDAVAGVIREGEAAGDVTLPPDFTPERLGLAILHQETGAQMLMQRSWGDGRSLSVDSLQVLVRFGDLLLDDLGWRPLSRDHDFLAAVRRMWLELFPEQVSRHGLTCYPSG